MARLSYSREQYSLTLQVVELNTSSTYEQIHIWVNGVPSGNLAWGSSGYSGSKTYTVSVNCGTTYTVRWRIRTASNEAEDTVSVSSLACPIPVPSPITEIVYTNVTQTGFDARWYGGSGADYYRVELYEGYDTYPVWEDYNYSATSIEVSGRKPDTRYVLKVYGRNSSGNGEPKSREVYTLPILPPSPPSSVGADNSEGSTSIYVSWSYVSNADYFEVVLYRQGSSTPISPRTETGYDTTFSGLTLGETYYASVRSVNDGGKSSYRDSNKVTLGYPRPQDWTGFNYIAQGSNFYLPASTWNSFLDRINEFRRYRSPNLGDASFNRASSGSDFRAVQMNQASNAISAASPNYSPPNQVGSGDEIRALYFSLLQSSVNSIYR
ncbi:hypothetical protein EVU96_09415 [Bacillus infantis]|uniref:fibronectin type III domain-containing protein n=1 Tax=Bacillus infantis TaxID=324767 RepID=UPI00101CE5DE|nr:fibronectin type III domain-containing protein [Bacillus infantis]RYI30624.1 hypothetical protein EVU96_09415 [Bacillus infantis]